MPDSPDIGPTQGKLWGFTQKVFGWNGTSAHLIHVNRGGYCSCHSHEHRWNRFLVLRGYLKVTIFEYRDDGDDQKDVTTLGPGEVSDVPPGVGHMFEAIDDVDAVEFYWAVCDDGDIDRHGTVGGMRKENEG